MMPGCRCAGLRLILIVSVTACGLLLFTHPVGRAASNSSQTSTTGNQDAFATLTPEQAQALLAAVAVLRLEEGKDTEFTVRSEVQCFCLHKGPHTIRELRRVATEWFRKGVVAFEAHRYEEAITAFTKATQAHPREARAYINRGAASGKLGHYQPAIQDLTRAMHLNPHQAEAYYVRSLVALLMGNVSQAQQDGHAATRLGYAPALRLSQGIHGLPVTGMLEAGAWRVLDTP